MLAVAAAAGVASARARADCVCGRTSNWCLSCEANLRVSTPPLFPLSGCMSRMEVAVCGGGGGGGPAAAEQRTHRGQTQSTASGVGDGH